MVVFVHCLSYYITIPIEIVGYRKTDREVCLMQVSEEKKYVLMAMGNRRGLLLPNRE
jgi:ribonuclease D